MWQKMVLRNRKNSYLHEYREKGNHKSQATDEDVNVFDILDAERDNAIEGGAGGKC